MSAEAERHWFDLPYWLGNFPGVRLNAGDNEHVPARSLFRPWSSSEVPPIVAVQFTPRAMQRPPGPSDTSWIGIVGAFVSIIPGVGTVARAAIQAAKIGIGIEQGLALQEWARNHKAAPDDFSPHYSPQEFLVPMPLDRAQLMVAHPWYAPAMVYQFQEELQAGDLRPNAAAAYSAILQAMLPAGTPDPPAYTKGEAPIFAFLTAPTTQSQPAPVRIAEPAAALVLPGGVPGNPAVASDPERTARSTAAPLAVAGVLLVLGAPLLLVAAIAGAFLVRKP